MKPKKGSTSDTVVGTIAILTVIAGVVWGMIWLTDRSDDSGSATPSAVVPQDPRQEQSGTWLGEPEQPAGGLTAAEEFELEMLVLLAFVEPATVTELCDTVDTVGADAAADVFELTYDPSLTPNNLPYSHEGAARAFAMWCA